MKFQTASCSYTGLLTKYFHGHLSEGAASQVRTHLAQRDCLSCSTAYQVLISRELEAGLRQQRVLHVKHSGRKRPR